MEMDAQRRACDKYRAVQAGGLRKGPGGVFRQALAATVAAGLALSGSSANALSCIKPDPVRTFLEISEVETPYYILLGTLEFDVTLQPDAVDDSNPNPQPIPARFAGKGLTLEGFTAEFAGDVTLQPLCAGPWCGGAAPGIETLYFAAVEDGTLLIEADPCGSKAFSEPTQEMLDAMKVCIQGGACEAKPDF